jgi:hypothetical protein
LSADPHLADLRDIAADLQDWGTVGVHFRGRWGATGDPVLVKVGIGTRQLWWMRALAVRSPELVPRLYASGCRLGTLDVGWAVMERIADPGPPRNGREFTLLLEAGVRFHAVARELDGPASVVTQQEVRSWLEKGIAAGAPGPAAEVLRRLPSDWAWLVATCGMERCHGDLHLSNVLMRRTGRRRWQGVLIDFETSVMPWPFDAALPQILNSEPGRRGCRHLVAKMARLRRAYGLAVPDERALNRVSTVVLGWFALREWWLVGPDPDPAWRAREVWTAENERYIKRLAALRD